MERLSNPLSTSVLGTIKLGPNEYAERQVLTTLINHALNAENARKPWLDRQRALTRLRYGIRTPKTFPWKNASNLAIPFTDQVIRKYKPTPIRLLVEPNPIVEFVGTDKDAVQAERTAEIVYNWLFKTEMDAIEPMAYTIDTYTHRGFALVQVGWEFVTEYECRIIYVPDFFPGGIPQTAEEIGAKIIKEYELNVQAPKISQALDIVVNKIMNGAEFVKLAFRHTIRDRPAIWDRDPVQIIAPPRTTSIEDAEWIVVQHVFSARKLKQLEADGFFIKDSIGKVLDDLYQTERLKKGDSSRPDVDYSQSLQDEARSQDDRERIWGIENHDNILIWEIYHWHDIDNDGLVDRTITYIHPRSLTKLRCTPYPYSFHCWPFVKFDFEKTNRRYHSSRGITQMLMDIQLEINAQHNAKIDGMTLRNAPVYQMPVLAGFRSRNFRATPGTVIHTPSGARMEPLIQDRGAFPEQEREENLLRTIGEHYIGVFDATITSPLSTTRARTATEIQAIMQYTAATATFDAILFQLSCRKLHSLIWDLFMDLGPQEIKLKVSGADPQLKNANIPGFDPKVLEDQLITIKKADINKKFKLMPTGTIANTNRALELANAREAVSMYINDQTGFINPLEIRHWHLSLLAQPRWSRRILGTPKDAAWLKTLQAAAQAIQEDPALALSLGAKPMAPDVKLPRQELAQSGQSGIQAQQP